MDGARATLLVNRYRVVRPLGQGGMGSVWLAEDTKLDNRSVAIKMLPAILVSNKRAYNQLKAEALVSLKLTHPNIATVRAFEENDGNPFLVMDYIDGLTLDEYLAKKGKLTEEATYCILEPVARALDYAHAKGVVHRDVKPGNVMITWDGDPYILDFGIAREIQETMTRVTGKMSSGTLLYMSPEQLHGAAPKPAQDVYSFAALAYECLTGRPPFSRGQVEWQIINDLPDPLPDTFAMGRHIMAGLAKKPEDRLRTCLAVLDQGAVTGDELKAECPENPPPSSGSTPVMPTSGEEPETMVEEATYTPVDAGSTLSSWRERWRLPAIGGVALTVVAMVAMLFRSPSRSTDAHVATAGVPSVSSESLPGGTKPPKIDETYVEVGVLVGRVGRLERSDGMASEIDSVMDLNSRARSHYELQKWDVALRSFAEAKAAAERVLESDRQRAVAKAAARRAESAAARAEAVKAERLVPDTWNHAIETRDRAKGEFGTLRFEIAAQRYTEAEGLFVRAEEAALAEAARRKIPTLKLVAKVGGREVSGAKIRVGDREYVTPVSFGEVHKNDTFGPFSLSYTEEYRLYEGSFKAFTVDWEGAKTYVFELKEHPFPEAGTRKVITLDARTTMAFRWCPAGEFTMGSPAEEPRRKVDEKQHRVKIMKGYWMGETEVTQGQWKSLMDGADIHLQARRALNDDTLYELNGKWQTLREWWNAERDSDPDSRCGDVNDSIPIYFVNWGEAVEYCRRLTARERGAGRLETGYEYRLPTEAEWERACRAGTSTALPNGCDMEIIGLNNAPALDAISWYGGNSSSGFIGGGFRTDGWREKQYPGGIAAPRAVATRMANNWDIHDMLGNVYEWCGDWFSSSLDEESDPTGLKFGRSRVVRGGGWDSSASDNRPAARFADPPTRRTRSVGFRVALAPVFEGYPYGVEEYRPAPLPPVRTVRSPVGQPNLGPKPVAENPQYARPPNIRFCRHCRAEVPPFLRFPCMCERCWGNLLH